MATGPKKKVGVLALQGDFERHEKALSRVGAEPIEVRSAADLDKVDALVIPGGESSTMLKLLEEEQLLEPLRDFGARHSIFGTCAGAILLASEVLNPPQRSLGRFLGMTWLRVSGSGAGCTGRRRCPSLPPD